MSPFILANHFILAKNTRQLESLCCFVLSLMCMLFAHSASANNHTKASTDIETQACDLRAWSEEEKIGQLFLVGMRELQQVEDLKAGGVILYRWNMPNVEATRDLTRQLQILGQKKLKVPLFIATDHEGGKVLRLRKGMTPFPDASSIGALNDPLMAFKVGKIMGLELASLGINMNLAPVLDLGNAKSFLENRVWGVEAARVSRLTLAFSQGLESSRVMPVAKHFPGHAGAVEDTHFRLPIIKKSLNELWEQDILPFKNAINNKVPALMTAHVEIPAVDRGPASLSRKFVNDILRKKIGFNGLVMTDDLEMAGALREGKSRPEDAALRALKAGSDILMIAWSKEKQKRIKERIERALREGELSQEWLRETVCRIVKVKNKYIDEIENPFWRENLAREDSLQVVRDSVSGAVQWVAGNRSHIHASLGSLLNKRWNVVLPHESLAKAWRRFRPKDQIVILPAKADSAVLDAVQKLLKKETVTFLVSAPRPRYDDEIFKGLLNSINERLRSKRGSRYPLVWVHQGPQPVHLPAPQEMEGLGLVALNGSSLLNWNAYITRLRLDIEGIEAFAQNR